MTIDYAEVYGLIKIPNTTIQFYYEYEPEPFRPDPEVWVDEDETMCIWAGNLRFVIDP